MAANKKKKVAPKRTSGGSAKGGRSAKGSVAKPASKANKPNPKANSKPAAKSKPAPAAKKAPPSKPLPKGKTHPKPPPAPAKSGKPKAGPPAKAPPPPKSVAKAAPPAKDAPKAPPGKPGAAPPKAGPKAAPGAKAPARGAEPAAPKLSPAPAAAPAKAPAPLTLKGRGKSRLANSRAGKPLADMPSIAVRKSTSEAPKRPSERPPIRESNRPPAIVSLPIPVLPVARRPTVEERAKTIDERLVAQSEEFRQRYLESFDMSWIYHDSALEGVVYTYAELRAALGDEPLPVTDSSLQPTVEDIRRHKEAIEFVRDFATKKQRLPITVDVVKKVYLILHPSEGDIKTVKYRKDIPQHRLYFHEYAAPDKIAYKVRQVVDWINDPETRKTRNGLRLAARAHYDLLRVFPFPADSGKVSRLFMNLLLMRSGLPPAIIHSTERQRYYDALKGSANTVLSMVQEAVENALSSVEKLLDERETKTRAFVS